MQDLKPNEQRSQNAIPPDGASVPLVNTNKCNYIQICNWHERDARASSDLLVYTVASASF